MVQPAVAVGQFITATATDPNGNTSEFSGCVQVTGSGPVPTQTAASTETATPVPTATSTATVTATATPVPTITLATTPIATATATRTATPIATATATRTATLTRTATPTRTITPTVLPTPVNHPPDCTHAGPSSPELWPPNHKLVAVSITGVTDPDGDPLTVTITSVTQDEPLNDEGDGNSCPDATGLGNSTVSVRSERSGLDDGRVYHLNFTAVDGRGGQCTGTAGLCVPHDQRPGHVCGDQGPIFSSTGPCNLCVPSDRQRPENSCEEHRQRREETSGR